MILTHLIKYSLRKVDKRPIHLGRHVDLSNHHVSENSKPSAEPKVSIIIPTKDKANLLKRCIDSIRQLTRYTNIELIIVDNNSKKDRTTLYLDELRAQEVTVISYPGKFNFSEMCNNAAEKATGEYLCFLNNDTEALEPNWLSSMVDHASQKSTGLVGAVLTFPDGRLQHIGIALGYTGAAGHPGRGERKHIFVPSNCYQVSAVTFACAVISADKFKLLGGLNPEFPFAFNDVDISIRAASANLVNVICTHARLLHGESLTRNRTVSFRGFLQGVHDVLLLLKTHSKSLSENFFVRGVLSDKFVQKRDSKSTKHHPDP
jgi:GT2 family glycosyltransferase